jgi:hypothetical protein
MFNWIWTQVQIVGLARDPSEVLRGDGESELAADTPDSAPKFSFPLAVLKLGAFYSFFFSLSFHPLRKISPENMLEIDFYFRRDLSRTRSQHNTWVKFY